MFTTEAHFRSVPLRDLAPDALLALSKEMKLSLSGEDMAAVQAYFREAGREPTDVELEVIAQTWSEHCKHRIFGATIEHAGRRRRDGRRVVQDLHPQVSRRSSRPSRALSSRPSTTTPASSNSMTSARSA
jgi:phosphoribosylformylglycinamidine (FGAM) synthase-like enzyme